MWVPTKVSVRESRSYGLQPTVNPNTPHSACAAELHLHHQFMRAREVFYLTPEASPVFTRHRCVRLQS
jgi:hypothetical protein